VRLLVDVSAGEAITQALRGLGHDVLDVRDRDPRMADIDILSWSVAEQRLVVTMDKDFGELIYRSALPHTGVLLLRLEAARTAEKVRTVEAIFGQYADQLIGRFAVFQDGKLRIRWVGSRASFLRIRDCFALVAAFIC
jgi:predicted nuclease of predicted toxin-antitoxin system